MNKNKGNILLPVVIVALVGFTVFGGLILRQRLTPTTPSTTFDTQTQQLSQQGSGDDVTSIENDLSDTDLSDLDKELKDIDKELSAQ